MPEISVDVSEDVAHIAKGLQRGEIQDIVSRALRERASEELMYDLADEMLGDSELEDRDVQELSDDLKKRVARRHGIEG